MPILAAANATTTAGKAAAPVAAALPFNVSNLVFNIDVFLLCCVAFFVLLLLPRATIRFTHKREWIDGHFLRSVRLDGPAPVVRRPSAKRQDVISPISPVHLSRETGAESAYTHEYSDKWGATTDASHTYVSSHVDILRKASTASGRERRSQNVPTHMPGWSTMLPRAAAFLRNTIRPGLTIGKSIILLGYFGTLLYAGLYMSNPFTDPLRAGFVAASQIPVVMLLGTKNNLLGMLIGFGYERLNYFHRFAGRMFVLAANVHAIGYFYKWTAAGTFAQDIAKPTFSWALVALICADLLLLLSTDFIRTNFYNAIFIPSHIASMVILLVSVCEHVPVAKPYVYCAVGFYGLDRLLRIIRSRVSMARLRPLPDLGVTRVEVPAINAGWRAGQHVRLRVLSWGMGWRGWAEAHPFTIASVSRCPSGEGLVLMVKKAGDWTGKLYDLAQRADYGEANGLGSSVQVVIEGPYGGPGHAIFSSFSGAMFVAGGSGITFALAAVQDLVKKDLEYRSRVRAMELVWCIQDPAALGPLLPLFASLLAQSYDGYASLRISVFYTRAPASPDVFKTFRALPPGLTLSPARPKLGKVLSGVVDRAAALFSGGHERRRGGGGLTGVIVGVCGPAGLGDDVRKAVAGFDPKRRKTIGGIELHEE
ncbi:incomplete iron reductase [Dichomitus squalens]|uniref:ferric-chelate reductase (NADPH) n=1 Tax=Dichomitus squalens TaxID=114155 RepID=A0A4Q9NN12_9APHY|nr:incomplete iron reductase [Dichomitus squalens]TBU42007.1 incomplete iron reductase [Dichomitus squalens]